MPYPPESTSGHFEKQNAHVTFYSFYFILFIGIPTKKPNLKSENALNFTLG
jgi:hypothetical protein